MSSTSFELSNEMIRAGAGAGKTTELTRRVLWIAENFKNKHQRYPRLVVTTFTRKATQELKERLLMKSLEEAPALIDYINNKSMLNVSTIHGLLSVYLNRYGIHLGLDPGYQIIDAKKNSFKIKKCLRKLFIQKPEYFSLLEEKDLHTLTVIAEQYYELWSQNPEFRFADFDDLSELFKTECQSVAENLEKVALRILSEAQDSSWQDYGRLLKTIATELKKTQLSEVGQMRSLFDGSRKPNASKKSKGEVTELIDSATDEEVKSVVKLTKEFLDHPSLSEAFLQQHHILCQNFELLLKEFVLIYEKDKIESGEITQSDLELLALRLIRVSPETAEAFSQEWDYWMIDEYQDTSPIQVEILKHLIGEKPSFVVGDPQQSIYLFRGARSELFFAKHKEIQEKQESYQELLKNYRSEPELLEFFNHLFTRISDQFKAMIPKNDPELNFQTEFPVADIVRCVDLEDQVPEEDLQAQAVIHKIQQLHESGVELQDICILFRTNKDLKKVEKLGQKYKVPMQIHGSKSFFYQREIRDALSLLKFLVNPHDNLNLLEILRSPWLKISDQKLIEYCAKPYHSLWMQLQNENHEVLEYLKKYSKKPDEVGVTEAWIEALVELGLFDFSHAFDNSGKVESNLWKLVSQLKAAERSIHFSYLEFIDQSMNAANLEEASESDATPLFEPYRVNLMTVHASKGLQFAHIILPYIDSPYRDMDKDQFHYDEDSKLWSIKIYNEKLEKDVYSLLSRKVKSDQVRREKLEFERLFYVALTRAKKTVCLIDAETKKKSWSEFISLDLSEGIHQKERFAYQARIYRNTELKAFHNQRESNSVHPSLWKQAESQIRKSISITALLEEQFQNKNSTGKAYKMPLEKLPNATEKAFLGVQIHKLFEYSKYHDWTKLSDEIQNPQLKKQFEDCVQFVSSWKNGLLFELIQNGFVEWGFTYQQDDVLVQGQIDLWSIDNQGNVWVIDYKTGSAEYEAKAFAQLALYAEALKKCKRIPENAPIHLAIIYLFDQKISEKVPGSFPGKERGT